MRVVRVELRSPVLQEGAEADVFAVDDVVDLNPIELLRRREALLHELSGRELLRERGGVLVEEVDRDPKLAKAPGEGEELIGDVEVEASEEVVALRSVAFGVEDVVDPARVASGRVGAAARRAPLTARNEAG